MRSHDSTEKVRIRITFRAKDLAMIEKVAEQQNMSVPQFIVKSAVGAAHA